MIDYLQVRDRLVAVCLARFLDEDVSSILRGAFPLLLALYAGCREKERKNYVVYNPEHKPCRAFGVPSLYFETINFVYEDISSPVYVASFFGQI